MKKAVLFDLDGTILDTSNDIGLALGTALGTTFTYEQVNRFIGHGLRNAVINAMKELGFETSDEAVDAAKKRLDVAYRQVPVRYTKPYPGVHDLLRRLQSKGIALGVYSNKDQDLVETVLSICFPDIDFCFEAGWHGKYEPKPSAQAVHAFCDQLGLTMTDILYVGDSDVDYRTARNANADYRILTWGSRSKEMLLATGVDENLLIAKIEEIEGLF
ncbi:MAG: HAD family hydrolase [Sphaerochaetaceae bacterium]|nr:HAD family hydrolase [Sphaerochaetaceae bacterium]